MEAKSEEHYDRLHKTKRHAVMWIYTEVNNSLSLSFCWCVRQLKVFTIWENVNRSAECNVFEEIFHYNFRIKSIYTHTYMGSSLTTGISHSGRWRGLGKQ